MIRQAFRSPIDTMPTSRFDALNTGRYRILRSFMMVRASSIVVFRPQQRPPCCGVVNLRRSGVTLLANDAAQQITFGKDVDDLAPIRHDQGADILPGISPLR